MATLSVVIAQIYNPQQGYKSPVPSAESFGAEVITTSGSSQQATILGAQGSFGAFWCLRVSGGDVKIKFGDNPTVGASDFHWYLHDGDRLDLAVSSNSQKLAVIDA
jgi:hypothetical protein